MFSESSSSAVLARHALELVEARAELGMSIEAFLFGDDRQARSRWGARRGGAGDRARPMKSSSAVITPLRGAAFVVCVVELGVHPSAAEQLGAAALHALLLVRLAELGRDLRRLVVEVSAPVGPADVVQDEERQRFTRCPRPSRASTRSSL